MRILIYATHPHPDDDNLSVRSADTWLKTLQAIFDTSQGFLNAIVFVFMSRENMQIISQFIFHSHYYIFNLIFGESASTSSSPSRFISTPDKDHGKMYGYYSPLPPSHPYTYGHEIVHESSVCLSISEPLVDPRQLLIDPDQQDCDEMNEVDDDGHWTDEICYSNRKSQTNRHLKCSFAEG